MADTETDPKPTETEAPVEHKGRATKRRRKVQRRGNYWASAQSVEEKVADQKAPPKQEPKPKAQPETVRDIPVLMPSLIWCAAMFASASVSVYLFSWFCISTAAVAAYQRVVAMRDQENSAALQVVTLYATCALALVFTALTSGMGWALAIICFGIAYDIGEGVFENPNANPWDVPLATAIALMTTGLVVAVVVNLSHSYLPWLCAFAVWLLAPAAHKMFGRYEIPTPTSRYTSCRFDSITLAAPICAVFVALLR